MKTIPKLEYDLVDHCNLGCNFCIHNAQLKPKAELNLKVVEDELKSLFSKFHVEKICLKGGEPLIHSNIIDAILTIKKHIHPDTQLSIATNGIRLATLTPLFFTIIKHLEIHLTISEYGIDVDYDKIYAKLDGLGISYCKEKKVIFYDFLDKDGKQNPHQSFKECRERQFYPLYRDKRFYLCCFVYDVPFMNNHLGIKVESNSVSIDENEETIMKYLYNPCSTCRFCAAYQKPHDWEKS